MSPEVSGSSQQGKVNSDVSMSDRYDLRILNSIRQMIRAADIDSRKLAAEHKVTSPQLMCLMALVENGTMTAVDIAQRVHLSTSTLVGVLDRLESKKLIQRQRSHEDRREVSIVTTEKGKALVAKTPFPLQYSLEKALKQLSVEEQQQIAACMERLAYLMGAEEIDTGPMLEIVGIHAHQNKAH